MNQFKEHGFPEERNANVVRENSLKFLDTVRKDNLTRKTDWGYHACSIPPLDWAVIKVRFPELMSPDHEIKHKAWAKFLNDPVSEPYRVQSGVSY